MGIDASIYSQQQATPDIMGSIANAMKLKDMVRQNQIADRAQNFQNTLRTAYQVDPTTGAVAFNPSKMGDLVNIDPVAANQLGMQMQQQKLQRQEFDLKTANDKLDLAGKVGGSVSNPQQADSARSFLMAHGFDQSELPQSADPADWQNFASHSMTYKDKLTAQTAQESADAAKSNAATAASKAPSEIARNNAEAKLVVPKALAEIYGRSSPTNAMAGDYQTDVKPIKASQLAMNQMIDNYEHPSPQGDASLVLNAFRIKFPNAPDVNSLEELSKSQAVPDQWKQMATHAISGGLDQGTRDNLMRDGVSTYRANYNSYQDIAKKYQGMAQQRGVPLGGMTDEPALDNTFAKAQKLQDKIGPYVPPPARGGMMSGVMNAAASVMGGGPSSAVASRGAQYRPGAIVTYGGKHYTVGADGDTLNPVAGK